jgi:phytoene desaturase
MKRLAVIGTGFSGLAAACFAAKSGNRVEVFEKNATIGGRARTFSDQGFMFDMGPSWYWMPAVFEKFFAQFNRPVSNYYELKKLDPGFQIFFSAEDVLSVPAEEAALFELFEKTEKGSADQLKKFLDEGKIKYEISMDKLVYRPAISWFEFMNLEVLSGVMRTHIFSSMRSYVRKYFKDPRLIALMEFPVLFLGAMPQHIPALYSLMNYSALVQGTWYPMGGMGKIIEGMAQLATELGVEIYTDAAVNKIRVENEKVIGLETRRGFSSCDAMIASADYHHTESKLLDQQYRNYDENYWKKKTFAPSSLIFYLGLNKKVKRLIHHNLFFDADLDQHARDIYDHARWPEEPLFYVCCPSKTDPSVAPIGYENLFVLIPLATGLTETETLREAYYQKVMQRMEKVCGENIRDHVVFKKSYCVNDFANDYNAYGGNAYGLANTLRQTAVLKPTMRNKKVKNLFYAGQLTVPGPGIPPSLISGEIAAGLALDYLNARKTKDLVSQ